jgi:hypothetical protein
VTNTWAIFLSNARETSSCQELRKLERVGESWTNGMDPDEARRIRVAIEDMEGMEGMNAQFEGK